MIQNAGYVLPEWPFIFTATAFVERTYLKKTQSNNDTIFRNENRRILAIPKEESKPKNTVDAENLKSYSQGRCALVKFPTSETHIPKFDFYKLHRRKQKGQADKSNYSIFIRPWNVVTELIFFQDNLC